ncbi:unnamed protein product [Phytomonas sp. EM1]|nr:unnamed protein product [Phytomonas sp. EM1]|eukprot:CCW61783.1 unnamed protein product [Phytomonas sp. isolate EM1]
MPSFKLVAPAIIAGIVFGIACMFLIDGILLAKKEVVPADGLSFSICVPPIFSFVGLLLFMLVAPSDIREDRSKAKVVLFISWLCMLSSSLAALTVVFLCYRGPQNRERAAPGVELAMFTGIVPLAGSILWWSRSADSGSDW